MDLTWEGGVGDGGGGGDNYFEGLRPLDRMRIYRWGLFSGQNCLLRKR